MKLIMDTDELAVWLHKSKPKRQVSKTAKPTGTYRQWIDSYLNIEIALRKVEGFEPDKFMSICFNGPKEEKP